MKEFNVSFVIIVHDFQELDSEEAEERKRSSQASKRIVEPETSNSSMEVGKSGLLVLLFRLNCINLWIFEK